MLLFPKAQQEAQKELDKVISAHRLPDWSGPNSLPYIRCVQKEMLRCMFIACTSRAFLTRPRVSDNSLRRYAAFCH
jgi:hypothetical protein